MLPVFLLLFASQVMALSTSAGVATTMRYPTSDEVLLSTAPNAYIPMREGACCTAKDWSVNSLQVEMTVTPTGEKGPIAGYGAGADVSANGSDKYWMPDASALDVTDPYTIMIWMKNSTEANQVFTEKGDNAMLEIQPRGTAGNFFAGHNNTLHTGDFGAWDGNWHHIVFAHSGTKVEGYADAVLIDNVSEASPAAANSEHVDIGTRDGGVAPYTGQMADFAVWGKKLTPACVEKIYKTSYWGFSNGDYCGAGVTAGTAQVSFVQELGIAADNDDNAVLTVTLTGNSTNTNTIIVSAASEDGGVSITVTDSNGNTWTQHASHDDGVVLFAAVASTAQDTATLGIGDHVYITFGASRSNRVATLTEWSGIASPGIDKTASDDGDSTAPDSGATAVTSQNDEMVLGVIAWSNDLNEWDSPGALFTELVGSNSSTSVSVRPEYRIVSAAAAYTATATLAGISNWIAICATFKAVAP